MKFMILGCLSLSIVSICAFTSFCDLDTVAAEVNPAAGDPAISAVHNYIEQQTTEGRIQKDKASWKTSLPRFPKLDFSKDTTYVWKLETNLGVMEVEFLPATAPNHVSNFIYLTQLGFFNDLKFHRVITGFMAQGGCPQGSGRGGPGYKFAGEYSSSVKHDRGGLLSMANAGQGTDGSQFFLTFLPTPWLDGKHTIFGKMRSGDAVLKQFEARGSRAGTPSELLKIQKATIVVESKALVSPKKKSAEKKEPVTKPSPKKESR
ncbi:MAG: peptidylprolyl isomerase [Planctomycetota bacterium]|nr:peptidylprolyl isomerase [Planctomycetota bacterium]